MIFKRTIEKKDFYINFYKSINYVLNLSKQELAILSYFSNTLASMPRELNSSQRASMTFSAANRRIVANSLGISIFNLNNYLKSLRDKGIILGKDSRDMSINPKLWVELDELEDNYTNEFTFNIK